MVKDAKITSTDFINFVAKNISNEKSDSIFERQFDLMNAAISSYTPSPFRENLANQVFNLILDLIKNTPKEQENRLVILKNKLTNFAFSDENKRLLLKWWEKEF